MSTLISSIKLLKDYGITIGWHVKTCRACGKEFTTKRNHTSTCGPTCRQKVCRKNRPII